MPDKIKISLEKGKIIENKWDNNNLKSSINDCLKIENYILVIDLIDKEIKKGNLGNNLEIKFSPEEKEINFFFENIKQFGKLYLNKFSFKKCPINISEDRKYELRLGKENIIIKTGTNSRWLGIICENPLDHTIEKNIWKIKILKTYEYEIMVGIASSDFDINRASFDKTNNFGWYYSCYSGDLFSGPPHNYQNKKQI